jgi:hypothetical protein
MTKKEFVAEVPVMESARQAFTDDDAEAALADMPPFSASGEKVHVVDDGLDPIQKMQLSRADRAREAIRVFAVRHDLVLEDVEERYMAMEMPDGTMEVRGRPSMREDNRPDSEIAKEASRDLETQAVAAIDGHRPDSNPKSALGIKKIPLHLVSPISIVHEAMAMAEGGMKYGPYNYRQDSVAATVYVAAALRHIFDWSMGEENAKDSSIHHLGHAKACCGIILDAQACGSLIDDRYKTEAYAQLVEMYTKMLPAMAERIAAMAKDLEAHQR